VAITFMPRGTNYRDLRLIADFDPLRGDPLRIELQWEPVSLLHHSAGAIEHEHETPNAYN